MANKNGIRFLEGAVAGIALGIAGAIFLNSKRGKKLKKGIQEVTADFYEYAAPKVKKLGKITEAEYKKFITHAAEQYAKAKKISKGVASKLIKEAEDSWDHFTA